MNQTPLRPFLWISLFCLFLPCITVAQVYKIPLDTRITNSEHIVLATLSEQRSYWDSKRENIYTLNILKVEAYLKGHIFNEEIALISAGGRVGMEAEQVEPSVQLGFGNAYALFLEGDNRELDHKGIRSAVPNMIQSFAYSCIQGALKQSKGRYIDLMDVAPMTEQQLINRIKKISGTEALKPDGSPYLVKEDGFVPPEVTTKSVSSITDGTGSTPTNFVAGTTNTDNELIINGSGFGSTAGKVIFQNADTGGSTNWTVPDDTETTDIVSWSNTQIRVKIPRRAGTGTVSVEDAGGTNQGSANISIQFAGPRTYNSFFGFADPTMQQLEYYDDNGSGGYTFQYNNVNTYDGVLTMTSPIVQESFERALETLRCGNFMNFEMSGTTTTAGVSNDGINAVLFNSALPIGVLGRANTRFTGSATGLCTLFDTFWRTTEVDVSFQVFANLVNTNTGTQFSWNFGPGAPGILEFDFETIALHELGHTNGLGHVIDNTLVMHFQSTNGKAVRSLSTGDLNGGAYVLSISTGTPCVAGFNGLTALNAGNCSISALPVELTHFHAKPSENIVHLHWQTATEINNHRFELEHSINGKDFKSITTVSGAGFSSTPLNYEYTHRDPMPGINYYRLKQIDFDGTISMSQIETAEIAFKEPILSITPNPLQTNTLEFESVLLESGQLDILILDSSGKLVLRANRRVEEGVNAIQLSVAELPKGMYWLKTEDGKGSVLTKSFAKF